MKKNRFFVIGPGLIIALLLSAMVFLKQNPFEAFERKTPVVSKEKFELTEEQKLGPVPEISFILEKSNILKLTKEQTEKIYELNSKWEKEFVELQRKLKIETKIFQDFMQNQKSKAASLSDIKKNMQPVSKISSELSIIRKNYWQAAMGILSDGQKEKLKELRKQKR